MEEKDNYYLNTQKITYEDEIEKKHNKQSDSGESGERENDIYIN